MDSESTTRVFPTRDLAMQVFQFGLVPVFHSSYLSGSVFLSPSMTRASPREIFRLPVVHLRVVRSTAVLFIGFSPLFPADWLKIL